MKITVTHLTGSRAGSAQELQEQQVLTVGRDPSNALAFDPVADAAVSGFHANLEVRGEQVVLTDLGSSNGTFFNGQRLSGPTPLVSGANVQFGEGGPIVVIAFAPATAAAAATAPAAAAPPATAAPPAAGAPPPTPAPQPAEPPQQPAGSEPAAPEAPAKKKSRLPALGCMGGIGALLLTCVLGITCYMLRDTLRQVVPPGAQSYLRKVPGLSLIFKAAKAPRVPTVRAPAGVRTPRLPHGGGGGDSDEAAEEEEAPTEAPTEEGSPDGSPEGEG